MQHICNGWYESVCISCCIYMGPVMLDFGRNEAVDASYT